MEATGAGEAVARHVEAGRTGEVAAAAEGVTEVGVRGRSVTWEGAKSWS